MKVQVLISTMNQANLLKLAGQLNIKSALVINQVTKNIKIPEDIASQKFTTISIKERGLSRSRNRAIKGSDADICIIADDDMYYVDTYENIISQAYSEFVDADLIAFYVDDENVYSKKNKLKSGRVGLLKSMKLSSVQLTFRKLSIINNNLAFNERFGAGSNNYMGEENIFLSDCIRKGLKIYYVPTKIATLRNDSVSTWFNGYDSQYFIVKGKVFYRLSKLLSLPLVIQFAYRKRSMYKNSTTTLDAIKFMISGLLSERSNGN